MLKEDAFKMFASIRSNCNKMWLLMRRWGMPPTGTQHYKIKEESSLKLATERKRRF
jgi:hypothetical protein